MSDTPDPARSAPTLRVLLLDDDTFMLDLLQDMLGELGPFEVSCATDARRALALLAAAPPHLLICDLSMPDMDGIEFLQAGAAAGFRGHVMLLTGMDNGVRKAAERLARAHGLAVLGAFQKPISPDELGAALAPLLAARGPGQPDSHNLTTHPAK